LERVSLYGSASGDTEEGRSLRRFPSTGKDDNWRSAARSIKGWLLLISGKKE
jgi:hypothetical protein